MTTADIEIRVPNIGDFADVPIIDVLVAPGDTIAAETPLVTLESEKTTMDVPAPQAGVVRSVTVHVGDKVSEGSMLLILAAEAAAAAAPAASAPAEVPAEVPEAPARAGARVLLPEFDLRQDGASADGPGRVARAQRNAQRRRSCKPVRAPFRTRTRRHLHAVAPTGPHDRITREDVQDFVKRTLAKPASSAPASGRTLDGMPFGLPPLPKVDFAKYGPVEVAPLSRIQKISGPSLHRSWLTVPHVTNNDEADVTELEAFRKTLNAERKEPKLTMLAFVVKAALSALRAFPDVNSSLDGDSLVRKRYYHIGFAADTPQGLVVPVVRNADAKGLLEIAAETAGLAAKAREGKLAPADMGGATFTISSLGGIGGTSFTPIVNSPEVAILGVSRSAMRPVWDGSAFLPRLMLPLSLSYDHRVIDGALAARFNAHLAAVLGDLRRAML